MVFEISASFDSEFAVGVGEVAFDGVHRNTKVLGDLVVAPVAGGEHTDGEFGGAEVVGDIVASFRIMDTTPTGGEAIGDIDDALEIVGPLGFMTASSVPPRRP